jgi:hypothetical protein
MKDRKIAKVMREFKHGTLYSSSGDKVTDRDQALAIALSEARRNKKKKRKKKGKGEIAHMLGSHF